MILTFCLSSNLTMVFTFFLIKIFNILIKEDKKLAVISIFCLFKFLILYLYKIENFNIFFKKNCI